jgi:hypothetical protein
MLEAVLCKNGRIQTVKGSGLFLKGCLIENLPSGDV